MLVHELKRSTWLNKSAKRRGRWDSSGSWNYSGRGQKGQNSRSWGGMPAWFEGWQTPLTQRLPKLKWFKRYFKLIEDYQVINLWRLEADERIEKSATITKQLLKDLRYISKIDWLVKILWTWDFSKSLSFEGIDCFSKTAKDKIEKTGGKIK